MTYQVPLLPLPATFLEALRKYDETTEKARIAAEACLIETPDFDRQRDSGKWPNFVFNDIHIPARSAFFYAAVDHGYGAHGCREDLVEIASKRLTLNLETVSPRYKAWFDAAWKNNADKKMRAQMGDLFRSV